MDQPLQRGSTATEQEKEAAGARLAMDGLGPLQRTFLAALRAAPGTLADGGPVAADPRSLALLEEAGRVARTAATVLIEGPSGSGKEHLARHIHRSSPRATGPFLGLNCAALPDAMQEALLFGHERGAFTGALSASPGLLRAAEGGTLFLDEVGELPLPLQAKLLRALQEREVLPLGATRPVAVDVRIVAATNRSLSAEVAAGRFREDLYWRLAVFRVETLPLASRRADILPLLAHLLAAQAISPGVAPPIPEEAALERLLAHGWPGNVRELGNVVERALILCDGRTIRVADLRFDLLLAHPAADHPAGLDLQSSASGPPDWLQSAGLQSAVRAREAEAIRAALARCGGRRTEAASALGISERTLRYKLAALAGRPRRSLAGGRAQQDGAALQ
jgi:two-component system response regulator FlrC